MKLILSRKGFDSKYGRVPSPVLDGKRPVSFPIPGPGRPLSDCAHLELKESMRHLTATADAAIYHFDPDLARATFARPAGWRAAFGQVGSAQGHLRNQDVGPGDVFLFFGWFRDAYQSGEKWIYPPGAHGAHSFHALFGWLQVGEKLPVDELRPSGLGLHAYLEQHPHWVYRDLEPFKDSANTLYVAASKLKLSGRTTQLPGAGVFTRWSDQLQLTHAGRTRRHWRLPRWIGPAASGKPQLSCHTSPAKWSYDDKHAYLRSNAIGQEFVLQNAPQDELCHWIEQLIQDHTD